MRKKGLRIIKQLRDITALERGEAKSESVLQKKQKQDRKTNIVAGNGKVQKLNISYQVKRETGIILKINWGDLQ